MSCHCHRWIWTWTARLLLAFCVFGWHCHPQASACYVRDPFRLSAFCSCLTALRVNVARTFYEYDPDPRNEYGSFNGQWKVIDVGSARRHSRSTPVAYFFPHTPKHVQAAVRCAELLGMCLLPKGLDLDDLFTRRHEESEPDPAPEPELTVLHQSESGLIFEQLNGATGVLQRCISHNQDPAAVDTCVEPDRPWYLLVNYVKMLFGALYVRDLSSIKRVLMIGLGGGSFPNSFYKLNPDIEMDIAELDGAMPDLAAKWFHYTSGRNTKLYIEDGAKFITRAADGIYDLAIIDAYDNENRVPDSISNTEFAKELLRVLSKGGVAALNLFNNTGLELAGLVRRGLEGVWELRDGHSTVMLGGATSTKEEIRARALALEREFTEINIDSEWLLEKFHIKRN